MLPILKSLPQTEPVRQGDLKIREAVNPDQRTCCSGIPDRLTIATHKRVAGQSVPWRTTTVHHHKALPLYPFKDLSDFTVRCEPDLFLAVPP